jgi:hypothetical protein
MANSAAPDTSRAVGRVLDDLRADEAQLTFLFFGSEHDESIVREELDRRAGERAVAGTTAGELSSLGFTQNAIVGMSWGGPRVRATIDVITNLRELSLVPLVHLSEQLARRIDRSREDLDPDRHIWILLPDGLSGSEDLLTPFFMQSAPETNLVGGSLGDGLEYDEARLLHHGRSYGDAAAVVLLEYDRPFELIHDNHMEFTDRWLEVTRVSAGGRVIEQLDGRPARDAYAEILEQSPDELDLSVTARHPLGFRFRGRPFVCSIVQQRDDGFLMANSVHEGARLNVLEPGDLVTRTREVVRETAESMRDDCGHLPHGMLAFHCLGRYLQAEQAGQLSSLAEALTQYPVAGLNTYGEQYRSMHTNHSLTGVLFG